MESQAATRTPACARCGAAATWRCGHCAADAPAAPHYCSHACAAAAWPAHYRATAADVGLRLPFRRSKKKKAQQHTAQGANTPANPVRFPQTYADLVALRTRGGTVLVEYGRPTCPYTVAGLKSMSKLAAQMPAVLFVFADITILGREPGLRGVPTFVRYTDGREAGERVVGTGSLKYRLRGLLSA